MLAEGMEQDETFQVRFIITIHQTAAGLTVRGGGVTCEFDLWLCRRSPWVVVVVSLRRARIKPTLSSDALSRVSTCVRACAVCVIAPPPPVAWARTLELKVRFKGEGPLRGVLAIANGNLEVRNGRASREDLTSWSRSVTATMARPRVSE